MSAEAISVGMGLPRLRLAMTETLGAWRASCRRAAFYMPPPLNPKSQALNTKQLAMVSFTTREL